VKFLRGMSLAGQRRRSGTRSRARQRHPSKPTIRRLN
jgi:hypothetical protein